MVGWLIFPFRYSVTWYLAGLARPAGVLAIFVGLLREQVWLYREARARQRDLESLHAAGQALAVSLDQQKIVEIIAAMARTLGVQVPADFGVAASTAAFREKAPCERA